MRCIVCESENAWEKIDQYTPKKNGLSICNTCGFISYPSRWKSKEEIFNYYKKNYRKVPPNSNNLFTGERKMHYHAEFLGDLFKKWTEEKKNPVIGEAGSAYGLVISWLKGLFPQGDISGTEWTKTMKRLAKHQFNIDLLDDLDWSKKYDLLMSYKVAEHQLDFDLELKKYREAIKDDGFLYISVPIWLGPLNNFGRGGFDLETYFDPDHVNVWTRSLFEAILKKGGFEIVKENHEMYDSTYLCKPCDPKQLRLQDFDSNIKNKEAVKTIHDAFHLFAENKYDEALALWANYPNAHISRIEKNRASASQNFEEFESGFLLKALSDCPESVDLKVYVGQFYVRFNKFDQGIKLFEEAIKMRPQHSIALENLADALLIMSEFNKKEGDHKMAVHNLTQARNVWRHISQVASDKKFVAIDKIYALDAMIPIPNEQ